VLCTAGSNACSCGRFFAARELLLASSGISRVVCQWLEPELELERAAPSSSPLAIHGSGQHPHWQSPRPRDRSASLESPSRCPHRTAPSRAKCCYYVATLLCSVHARLGAMLKGSKAQRGDSKLHIETALAPYDYTAYIHYEFAVFGARST